MARVKIGLLPLYLKLYDDTEPPSRRVRIDEFPRTIAAELTRRGLDVVMAPVCRIEKERYPGLRRKADECVDIGRVAEHVRGDDGPGPLQTTTHRPRVDVERLRIDVHEDGPVAVPQDGVDRRVERE